jgi:hypothetical protein
MAVASANQGEPSARESARRRTGAFRLSPLWVTGMSTVVAVVMGLTGTGGIIGTVSRFVGSVRCV